MLCLNHRLNRCPQARISFIPRGNPGDAPSKPRGGALHGKCPYRAVSRRKSRHALLPVSDRSAYPAKAARLKASDTGHIFGNTAP